MAPKIVSKMYTKLYLTSIHEICPPSVNHSMDNSLLVCENIKYKCTEVHTYTYTCMIHFLFEGPQFDASTASK